jgi:hypothetical protein
LSFQIIPTFIHNQDSESEATGMGVTCRYAVPETTSTNGICTRAAEECLKTQNFDHRFANLHPIKVQQWILLPISVKKYKYCYQKQPAFVEVPVPIFFFCLVAIPVKKVLVLPAPLDSQQPSRRLTLGNNNSSGVY